MMTRTRSSPLVALACALSLMMPNGFAAPPKRGASAQTDESAETMQKQEQAAIKHVNDAVAVVRKLNGEARMHSLLQKAKGVFLVPTYGRAALGLGAAGGAGVLLVKRDDGTWSSPAFYYIGGLSAGAQAGAEGGAMAFVLNNNKAVNKFLQKNLFSLSADSGLTIVNWSATAQGSIGDGDVTAWTSTRGLFGNVATVGLNGIRYNQNLTNAFYRQNVAVSDALDGKYGSQGADMLRAALKDGSR
ncbi:hypothetical protein INH39_26745 [Massilia violaceinigra]|uniref:Ysc84 actin-binding domain-containing protein n=1 Tax=Massilia violaceinigra TaxID=2045208 RepID=A0ABY4A2U4_9BURK|nr:YSC84-related protein [Massilia violaceinigra]UOD28993.1 hypothetical protein INH39_26745 [Massilia violaceinigra]